MAALSAKQIKAVEALLSEDNVTAAARVVGVSVATLYRWLNDPAFDEAYRAARTRLFESTLTRLQTHSSDAVKTLHETLTSEDAAAPARVSAARAILEFSLKAREQLELADRIKLLETALLAPKQVP